MKKNKVFLAGILAMLMILLVSCGKKPVAQPTEAPAAQTPGIFTVQLRSDSDYPLEGIGVYVYTDATKQELVWFARTDAEGKITFRDVTSEGYIAVLDGVSTDYLVEEYYLLTGENTVITVEAQMQSGVDLSVVTRKLGDVMFDFTVTSSDGKDYTLSELLKEKDAVVLNFWYLNCNPCRMEFPYLQEAYEAYSDRIELLALNPVDGTDETVAAFKEELELTFPMAACDPDWAKAMQLNAYPTTVIIDRFGVISLIHTGSITSAKVFTDAFAHFTAEEYEQGVVESIEDLETPLPGSDPNEPIELGGVLNFEATIPAGGTIYYNLYRVDGTLSVSHSDIYAEYNSRTYGPKSGGFSFHVKSPDTYTPAKLALSNSGTEDLTIAVKISKPRGVVDNPYSAKLDQEITTKVAAGNEQGVYYQVTASKTGYLIFECLESPEKVAEFDYLMQNLDTNAQRTIKEDGNDIGTKVSIKVSAGDKVKCWIVTEKDTKGNKYPGGTFQSKIYWSDTPVTEETDQVAQIDYAVTVTDENRKPLPNVSMNVDLGDGKPHLWTTNEKGVAHEKLNPGTYPVVLTLPDGYTAATTELTLTDTRPFASIKLDTLEVETAEYQIIVQDQDGNPAKGMTVMLGTAMKTTDENGTVTFTAPKGTHTVTVSKADGSIQNQTFEEGATEMTIVLTESGDSEEENKVTYKVKVVDYSGKVQSGVTVQILSSGSPVAVKTTDDTGMISAELPGGKYTVALAFTGAEKYYEKTGAVLTEGRPSLVLRVTGTKAKNPADEWFGPTFEVGLGGTYVSIKQSNVDVFFAFLPEKEGTYRISVTNPDAVLSHYGSINFPNKQEVAGATSTSYEINVKETNLGGTYAICVTGATEYILEIERIGSAVLSEDDIPWQVYQGDPPSVRYNKNPGQKLTYVDLTGKTADFNPVLGVDGVYHLNSATGKILYVNLGPNAQYISMYNMLGASGVGGTKFGKIFRNSDGSLKVKEDYTDCMLQYVNCRNPQTGSDAFEVYPLTEDLMYMLQNGGAHMGWWNEDSAQYLFADLGSAFNPELGWMFAVCY